MTTIAVAGKGGTGKTTLAGLIVRVLKERGEGPVLAIDADPSSNLHAVLGLPLERTVGDIREEAGEKARSGRLEAGVAKADLLDYEINASLVESEGVDLLAMGRPEGPGCYCAANSMLRTIVDRIAGSYPWVVIDNEAGLEHLSRRTTRDVDLLLVLSDPSLRGVTAAARVVELVDELDTRVGDHLFVLNGVDGEPPPELAAAIAAAGLDVGLAIPADDDVRRFDAVGRPLVELPDGSPMVAAARAVCDLLTTRTRDREGGVAC